MESAFSGAAQTGTNRAEITLKVPAIAVRLRKLDVRSKIDLP
jgi:hypothetical protein